MNKNIGIAYVIIPDNLDREKYISHCVTNSVVSIKDEYGMYEIDVDIPPNVLPFVKFPVEPYLTGSPVVYIRVQRHFKPIILNVLQPKGEVSDYDGENQMTFSNGSASVSLKPNSTNLLVRDGEVNIISSGEDKGMKFFSKAGEISMISPTFSVKSFTDEGQEQFTINFDGNVLEINKGEVKFSFNGDDSVSLETLGAVQVNAQTFQINDPAQSMVLGEALNTNLNTLITLLNTLITTLITYSTAQSASSAANPTTSNLTAALSVLLGQLNSLQLQIPTLTQSLNNHISTVSKTQ